MFICFFDPVESLIVFINNIVPPGYIHWYDVIVFSENFQLTGDFIIGRNESLAPMDLINPIYCNTINGKSPTDHGVINLQQVLTNGHDAGNSNIDNLNVMHCKEVVNDTALAIQAPEVAVNGSSFNVHQLQTGSTNLMLTCNWNAGTHEFVLASLPTSDPGIAGHVYNEGGTLKIST